MVHPDPLPRDGSFQGSGSKNMNLITQETSKTHLGGSILDPGQAQRVSGHVITAVKTFCDLSL